LFNDIRPRGIHPELWQAAVIWPSAIFVLTALAIALASGLDRKRYPPSNVPRWLALTAVLVAAWELFLGGILLGIGASSLLADALSVRSSRGGLDLLLSLALLIASVSCGIGAASFPATWLFFRWREYFDP
jgi:hypothetical protein